MSTPKLVVPVCRRPRVAELFLDAAKVDAFSELAQDAVIAASIALQSSCQIETLRHPLAVVTKAGSASRSI